MKANFKTLCTECRQPIRPGMEIGWSEEEEAWQHEECLTSTPTTRPSTGVCPKCFQHKAISGACGCG